MFASFLPYLKVFFVYAVAFYQHHLSTYMGQFLAFGHDFKLRMPEINLPNINMPDINIPDNLRDGTIEVAEAQAEKNGKDDLATALDVALEYAHEHHNMNGATRLLEELVEPNLDAGNIQNLREWASKIDAALALAKLIPYAGDQINEQIR